MKIENIKDFTLFADLPDDVLNTLRSSSETCQCKPGEILFSEGTFSEYFYLVIEGEIQIIKSLGSEDERVIAVSKKGSILGEMEIFSEEGTHTASARALTQVKLIKVSINQFVSTVKSCPQFGYSLLRLFTHRLQKSENLTIQDLREKNRKLAQAYHDLKIAQAAMIEKEKLEHELHIAGEMQRSILPKALPAFPGLDFGALIHPARQVGGDFYDFIPLDDRHIGVVIGDVCDKGMPAALFMTLSYSSIRLEALRNEDPSKTLRAINKHLMQINRSDMFVTVLYGILDCSTREFTYARAGHPLPLLLDGNNQPVKIPQKCGQAIGLFDPIQLDEQQVVLPEDGTLLIFSDGLSESIGESLKSPKLAGLCADFMQKERVGSQALCEYLFGVSAGLLHFDQLKDDFTVVAIRAEKR